MSLSGRGEGDKRVERQGGPLRRLRKDFEQRTDKSEGKLTGNGIQKKERGSDNLNLPPPPTETCQSVTPANLHLSLSPVPVTHPIFSTVSDLWTGGKGRYGGEVEGWDPWADGDRDFRGNPFCPFRWGRRSFYVRHLPNLLDRVRHKVELSTGRIQGVCHFLDMLKDTLKTSLMYWRHGDKGVDVFIPDYGRRVELNVYT